MADEREGEEAEDTSHRAGLRAVEHYSGAKMGTACLVVMGYNFRLIPVKISSVRRCMLSLTRNTLKRIRFSGHIGKS